MGKAAAKRLLAVLTAIAFLIAAALPGTALAMPTPNAMPMAAVAGQPCEHCPPQAPSGDAGAKKMLCGTLACAGVAIAFPSPSPVFAPALRPASYPAQAFAEPAGVAFAPGPHPPRPSFLV